MKNGVFNINSWVQENDLHNKIFRVFFKDTPEMEADFFAIKQIVDLGCGDLLIGFVAPQEDGTFFPAIYYHNLKDIIVEYYESDQEGENGKTI